MTLSRIALLPVGLYFYLENQETLSFFILLYCLLSDFFDGYLARKLGQETNLGALLDPIADKLLTIGLYSHIFIEGKLHWIIVTIILLRNFSQILSVPILIWWLKISFKIKPKWQPKWATALSFVLAMAVLFPNLFMLTDWISYIGAAVIGPVIILESYTLVTFLPRFVQIAFQRHDTFE